jgi:hypothetical protein
MTRPEFAEKQRPPVTNRQTNDNRICGLHDTCGGYSLGETIRPHAGEGLWPLNTVNMVIRTATASRTKGQEKSLGARRLRSGTTRLDRDQSTCQARARFHDARSAVRCCRESRGMGSARSAALSCTRASSAPISIRGAASNACSQSRSALQRRMRGTNAGCMRFG